MNLQWNLETLILVLAITISIVGSYLIIRLDWKAELFNKNAWGSTSFPGIPFATP